MASHHHPQSQPRRRNRARPLPPDVTARNLSMEKQRRLETNKKFLDLARLVPGLAPAGRLNKTQILNESIEHFRQQYVMIVAAAKNVQELIAENEKLVAELNIFRTQVGQVPAETKPITEATIQLMDVKIETYATSPLRFDDAWAVEPLGNPLMIGENTDNIPFPVDASLHMSIPPPALDNEVDFFGNELYQAMTIPVFQDDPVPLESSSSHFQTSPPLHSPLFPEPDGPLHGHPPYNIMDPTPRSTDSWVGLAGGDVSVSTNRELGYARLP